MVALGEPLELGKLLTVSAVDAVEQIEERGLVVIADEEARPQSGRRTMIRLAHPLYGETVRAELPRLRGTRRYRQLAEMHETGSHARADELRIALWRLESGSYSAPEPLLAALRLAWAGHDYPLAERFGWAAVEAGAGPEAAVLLAPVLGYGGKMRQAEALLEKVWEQPCDERTRTLLISTRLNIMATLGGRRRPSRWSKRPSCC